MQSSAYDYGAAVAIVADGRLVGLLPIERLVSASDDEVLLDALVEPSHSVDADVPIEVAANQMVTQHEPALAVADRGGRFLGLVPAARVAEILLIEHDEDLARLGGYQSSAGRDRRAAEEPLGPRLLHRLPWLIVGLAGAMASALLVGAFEEELEQVVLLALFVPAIVYMAAAVGAQTQTLLIRALSTNVDLARVFRQELITGVVLGAATAAVFYPFALLVWNDHDVALTVALALFASSSTATVIAMALPLGLRRLGQDPAFGSGPLATVIQDLLSIAIYFAIAVPLAT